MGRRRLLVPIIALGLAGLIVGGRPLAAAFQDRPEATAVVLDEGITIDAFSSFGTLAALPPAPATADLFRLRLAPGTSFSFLASDPGLALHMVESGTVTLRGFSADVTVDLPAVPFPELLPAGTEGAVELGGAFTRQPYVAGQLHNAGAEPVVVMLVLIVPVGTGTPEAATVLTPADA